MISGTNGFLKWCLLNSAIIVDILVKVLSDASDFGTWFIIEIFFIWVYKWDLSYNNKNSVYLEFEAKIYKRWKIFL